MSKKSSFQWASGLLVPRAWTLTTLGLLLLILLAHIGAAIASEYSVPLAVYRGINVRLHSHPTTADLDKIAGWGNNLVRLVIHADPQNRSYDNFYLEDGKSFNETAFKELDRFLDMTAERKMSVILSSTTYPGVTGSIWKDYQYWEQLEKLWTFIALRYRNHKAVVGYHPIDEPTLIRNNITRLDRLRMVRRDWTFPDAWKGTPKDYFSLVERIGQAINKADPAKIVVVSGVGMGGNPINYTWMRPVKVANAVYSFNMYLPHEFADAGKRGDAVFRYDRSKWDAVKSAMSPARDFGKKYGVRFIISGFGLTYLTEGHGAGEWLRDVIGYFEENGWSWAYWSYSIPLRNPAVANRNGRMEQSQSTERLTVLKEYWARNSVRTSAPLPAEGKKP